MIPHFYLLSIGYSIDVHSIHHALATPVNWWNEYLMLHVATSPEWIVQIRSHHLFVDPINTKQKVGSKE